jgi:putative redox protein
MLTITALTQKNPYATQISSRGFSILADESIESGGQNKGMNPMEIMGASLASCTSITLKMYIDRKKYFIDRISTKVEITQNEQGWVFEKFITLSENNLSEEDRERVLLIAKKCPTHKILEKSVIINTYLI